MIGVIGIGTALSILSIVQKAGGLLKGQKECEVFTYKEAMKYLFTHKKDSSRIVKGAIIREGSQNDYVVTTVFLDNEDNLIEDEKGSVLGFNVKAKSLDIELQKAFKDNNVIIVE